MAKAKKTKQQSTSEKSFTIWNASIDKDTIEFNDSGNSFENVEDYDEIAGIENRITYANEEFAELETELNARKASIDASNDLINKYEKQMDNVKNNGNMKPSVWGKYPKLKSNWRKRKFASPGLLESRKESFGEIEELLVLRRKSRIRKSRNYID